jgi:glucosamine-6-phosphate deaminase
MRLIIRDDETEACRYVANYVVERINAFHPTPEHPFILGLPTGSSPIGVYNELVRIYKAGQVRSSLPHTKTLANYTRSRSRM